MKIKIISFLLLSLSQFILFSKELIVKYQPHSVGTIYGDKTRFERQNITSDFGRRRGGNISKWHRGIDIDTYNQEHEDHILSINNGTIYKIKGGEGYKYIVVQGDDNKHFGYGHIFDDEEATSDGIQFGDMVLIKTNNTDADEYLIIDLTRQIALGTTDLPEITYNDITYEVTNLVSTDDPIAIIEESGDTDDLHVHLYLFHNYRIDDCGGYNNADNAFDPLTVIDYNYPYLNPYYTQYTVKIVFNDDNPAFENEVRSRINPNGDKESSFCVRTIMNNEPEHTANYHYSNAVMDISNVKLYIRPFYCDIEDNENLWGTSASNYKMIQGPYYRSEIDLGAFRNAENTRYPPGNKLKRKEHGDLTNTGIYPWAYTTNPYEGYPYDDYHFSDFFTRIHKDNPGGGNKLMANNNFHLPDIPADKEVKENGLDIGEMNALLLKKIEELTLYTIQQQKEIEELKKCIEKLSN